MHPHDETIVALSTPPGRGGIGVIRLSGPRALDCARKVFSGIGPRGAEPGRAVYGSFHPHQPEPHPGKPAAASLDTGYLTWHPAGRSYTGEDVVELSCHGSPVLIEQLLESLLAAGARAAHPGEFTYRAVLNGRIDLAQAEGVRDLINAPTAWAARVAADQVRGGLSLRLGAIREQLVEIICSAEAALEFAEEPDVAGAGDRLAQRLGALSETLSRFVSSYRHGRLLRDGARVVLAGRPNAGKSSLFNRLLRSQRAIVSPEPGTTRDFLSERIDLGGIPVTLIDTAGLNSAAQGVEAEGVGRSLARIEQADLVVYLLPCDEPVGAEPVKPVDAKVNWLHVASKSDLLPGEHGGRAALMPEMLAVSAVTGEGIDELRAAIGESLVRTEIRSDDQVLITDARHHDALSRCLAAIHEARSACTSGATEEIVLVPLHAALEHLAEITGETRHEEIMNRIFSTFCVGK